MAFEFGKLTIGARGTSQTSDASQSSEKEKFLKFLQQEKGVSPRELKVLRNMSLDSIQHVYSEEFEEFNSGKYQQSDTLFQFDQQQNTEGDDISLDDLAQIQDEIEDDEALVPTLDDIEKEMEEGLSEEDNRSVSEKASDRANSWFNKKNAFKNIDINNIDNYTNTRSLLRDMYKDEDVFKIVDEDGDGKLSDDEKKKFESYVKGEKDELELDDIKQTLKDIKNEKFDKETYKSYEVPELKLEDLVSDSENPLSQLGNTSGASNAGGNAGNNTGSVPNQNPTQTSATDATDTAPKTDYSKLDENQLNTEKTKEETALSEAQEKLSSLSSGESDELSTENKAVDDKKEAFDEAVKNAGLNEAQVKKDFDTADEALKQAEITKDQKEDEVNNKKLEIADITVQKDKATEYHQQMTANKETASTKVETANQSLADAEAALAAKQQQEPQRDKDGNEIPVDTSAEEAAVAAAQQAVVAAEAELLAAEQAEQEAQQALTEITDQLTQAETVDLPLLEANFQEASDDVTAKQEAYQTAYDNLTQGMDDETKAALDTAKADYDTAKDNFNTKKDTLRSTQQVAMNNAKSNLASIKSALTTKANEKRQEELKQEAYSKVADKHKEQLDYEQFKNPNASMESVQKAQGLCQAAIKAEIAGKGEPLMQMPDGNGGTKQVYKDGTVVVKDEDGNIVPDKFERVDEQGITELAKENYLTAFKNYNENMDSDSEQALYNAKATYNNAIQAEIAGKEPISSSTDKEGNKTDTYSNGTTIVYGKDGDVIKVTHGPSSSQENKNSVSTETTQSKSSKIQEYNDKLAEYQNNPTRNAEDRKNLYGLAKQATDEAKVNLDKPIASGTSEEISEARREFARAINHELWLKDEELEEQIHNIKVDKIVVELRDDLPVTFRNVNGKMVPVTDSFKYPEEQA